ncbi:hypothetical protein AAFF_G00388550 [Aldrovandia affinis]|uniref:Uncharacterized protein n=1 Tax=Aldrovandia affinis TaxID=143900 RepID=A0AAD7R410_9TELE|nr:hypothetical protein AAFF_G00388550 [Aldrovandia affinis]
MRVRKMKEDRRPRGSPPLPDDSAASSSSLPPTTSLPDAFPSLFLLFLSRTLSWESEDEGEENEGGQGGPEGSPPLPDDSADSSSSLPPTTSLPDAFPLPLPVDPMSTSSIPPSPQPPSTSTPSTPTTPTTTQLYDPNEPPFPYFSLPQYPALHCLPARTLSWESEDEDEHLINPTIAPSSFYLYPIYPNYTNNNPTLRP